MNELQREMVRAALQPVITRSLHHTYDDKEREALFREMARTHRRSSTVSFFG